MPKQLFVLLGIFIGFFFQSCASGNVWLTIQPDGSGKIQMVKKEIIDKRRASASFLSGGQSTESEIRITSLDMVFPSIHQLEMEGASFIYHKQLIEGKVSNCLLITLDTSADSPWFRYFGITELQLLKIQEESAMRDDLARFNNLTDFIVWEIVLPGKTVVTKDFQPLGPDWWLSNHMNRKAILKIPVRDMLKSRRKYSSYEVCSVL